MKKLIYIWAIIILLAPLATYAQFSCTGDTVLTTTPWKNNATPAPHLQSYCTSGNRTLQGYNDSNFNEFFCDSMNLPPLIDTNQPVAVHINTGVVQVTGAADVTTDSIVIGEMNAGGTAFSGPTAINSNLTAASANTTISMNLSAPIINNIANGDNVIDVVVQDDTEIISMRMQYCQLTPKAEISLGAGCPCKDGNLVSEKYGSIEGCQFCADDPILVSTAGTKNADSYFIGLTEFDLNQWQVTATIFPGTWICTNCAIPPYLLISDYLNGNSLVPGKVYKFRFAVGPQWDVDDVFFKIVPCAKKGIRLQKIPAKQTGPFIRKSNKPALIR